MKIPEDAKIVPDAHVQLDARSAPLWMRLKICWYLLVKGSVSIKGLTHVSWYS